MNSLNLTRLYIVGQKRKLVADCHRCSPKTNSPRWKGAILYPYEESQGDHHWTGNSPRRKLENMETRDAVAFQRKGSVRKVKNHAVFPLNTEKGVTSGVECPVVKRTLEMVNTHSERGL